MKTLIDLLLVTLVTVYVVDLSGFSDMLLDLVSSWMGRRVTQLKPFTCSLCMVWWMCLAFLLASARLSLAMVAAAALLSYLSYPIGQLMVLIQQSLLAAVNKLMDLIDLW